MEGKIVGIILSILGIAGLVLALIYINGSDSSKHLTTLLAGGLGGALAFFTGIWLVDHKWKVKATKPELMRVTES